MTNKTLVAVRAGVRVRIKIYIRHTENTELLPIFLPTGIERKRSSFCLNYQ